MQRAPYTRLPSVPAQAVFRAAGTQQQPQPGDAARQSALALPRSRLSSTRVESRLRAASGPSSGQSTLQSKGLGSAKEAAYFLDALKRLAVEFQAWPTPIEKVRVLFGNPKVKAFARNSGRVFAEIKALSSEEAFVLLCLPAIGQSHVLQGPLPGSSPELRASLQKLAAGLLKADRFYSSLGGILGYQAKCLELIAHNKKDPISIPEKEKQGVKFHMPQGPNLDGIAGRRIAAAEAAKGLEALPHMAEIWPLGGAGDRLGLECERTGKSVPTAMLQYCGRTLLEGLVRDLQARESLYFKLYGAQCTTPVVIMTSEAKDNHNMVLQTLRGFDWFGRGEENFRVICQPLVPVVSASTGEWVVPGAFAPMMKPGGHGAIWKLMLDEGIFTWLAGMDRQAALVRQISNPMAGTDATMLALTGAGYADGRAFGFASCERTAGASEGMNVLTERRLPAPGGGHEFAYVVTNLEYTEFERHGVSEEAAAGAGGGLPANTNILYVSLKATEAAVKAGVASGGGAALPGMIFNSKKTVSWVDAASGKQRQEPAGRLECTMQNLVDSLAQRFQEPIPLERHAELNTFVVFNKRRRVTSSAKKRRTPGSLLISQTPDGSFLDLMRNSEEVLQRCSVLTPELGSVEEYLETGPGFMFLFNPALGPLWDVVAQKIRGGALAPRSELVLEVAEAVVTDLRLDGSLIVEADCVLGRSETAAEESLGATTAPPVAGQTITYPASGSEAIQYNRVMPNLAGTSGMVVPLQRRTRGTGSVLELAPSSEQMTERHPSPEFGAMYSHRCARVRLDGVVVHNEGIDWACKENVYWQHKVKRHEKVLIKLHGQSEFEATNVCLIGSHTFEVPDGYKMVVSAAAGGGVRRALSPLAGRRTTWQWRYLAGKEGAVQLRLEEPISSLPGVPLSSRPLESEAPFTYMI